MTRWFSLSGWQEGKVFELLLLGGLAAGLLTSVPRSTVAGDESRGQGKADPDGFRTLFAGKIRAPTASPTRMWCISPLEPSVGREFSQSLPSSPAWVKLSSLSYDCRTPRQSEPMLALRSGEANFLSLLFPLPVLEMQA